MNLHIAGELARRDGFIARFDLDVPLAGVTAVLGQSGSGKSTLLRCIAGLEQAPSMTVQLGDEQWQGDGMFLAAHLRPVSMVFQDGRLFPHLSVRANLEFPNRRANRPGVRLDFDSVVEILALQTLLDRNPTTLSGGQRQRVALARALLAPARLWLLDEPMSSLDTTARREIAPYLARVCRELGVPVLYVTHALDEVHHLASRVIVLDGGRIVANQPIESAGSIAPIDDHGSGGTVLRGRAASYDARYDLTELELGANRLQVTGKIETGADVSVLIAARDVSIALDDVANMSIQNRLPGVIVAMNDDGSASCLVKIDCDGQHLAARVTRLAVDKLALAPGTRVVAFIKSIALAGVTP